MRPTPCKMVAVKIPTSKTPLIVVAIYRPTYNNTDYLTSMCDTISSIARKFVSKHQYTKQINEHFLDTFSMLGLSQSVTFPTRLDNTLDVFITNRPSPSHNRCEPMSVISDHDAAVYVNSGIMPKRHRLIPRTIHVWSKADSRLIQEELATFADELQNDHNL